MLVVIAMVVIILVLMISMMVMIMMLMMMVITCSLVAIVTILPWPTRGLESEATIKHPLQHPPCFSSNLTSTLYSFLALRPLLSTPLYRNALI